MKLLLLVHLEYSITLDYNRIIINLIRQRCHFVLALLDIKLGYYKENHERRSLILILSLWTGLGKGRTMNSPAWTTIMEALWLRT